MRVPENSLKRILGIVKDNSNVCTTERQQEWLIVSTQENIPSESFPHVFEVIDKVCQSITLPEVWKVRGDGYRIDRKSPEPFSRLLFNLEPAIYIYRKEKGPLFRVDGDIKILNLWVLFLQFQILDLIHKIFPERYIRNFKKQSQNSFSYHQSFGYLVFLPFIKEVHLTVLSVFYPKRFPLLKN
jgi:hypothetical protein